MLIECPLRKQIYTYIKGRSDSWALMQKQASPKYLTVKGGLLSVSQYVKHFSGEQTVAIYPIINQELTTFICFDVDVNNKELMLTLIASARSYGIENENLLIESSGSSGYHIYIAFDKPFKASHARKLGRLILLRVFPECADKHEYHLRAAANSAKIELFPKQDRTLTSDTLGNAIRLPLGFHTVKKRWSRLLDVNLATVRKNKEAEYGWLPLESSRADEILKENAEVLQKLSYGRMAAAGNNMLVDRPCFTEVIADGVVEGERSVCAFHYAMYLMKACKKNYNEAIDELLEWNKKNKPPLNFEKIQEAVQSTGKYSYPVACAHPFITDYCIQVKDCPHRSKGLMPKG